MYLRGLRGNTRLYLFSPPGSSSCPPNLVNGCYNTGLKEGCGDPQQFATYADLVNYANSRGEGLQQVSSAQEAMAICSAPAPPTAPAGVIVAAGPQAPVYGGAPPLPGAGPSAPPPALMPTGLVTPTIVTMPGPAMPAAAAEAGGGDLMAWLPVAAVVAIGFFLLRR